jgi:hypothetical protein
MSQKIISFIDPLIQMQSIVIHYKKYNFPVPSLVCNDGFNLKIKNILCPFAVYYLRYAVRSFFTLSRISLADGKRAGQKVQRKIAIAVQKVKSPLLFVPLF